METKKLQWVYQETKDKEIKQDPDKGNISLFGDIKWTPNGKGKLTGTQKILVQIPDQEEPREYEITLYNISENKKESAIRKMNSELKKLAALAVMYNVGGNKKVSNNKKISYKKGEYSRTMPDNKGELKVKELKINAPEAELSHDDIKLRTLHLQEKYKEGSEKRTDKERSMDLAAIVNKYVRPGGPTIRLSSDDNLADLHVIPDEEVVSTESEKSDEEINSSESSVDGPNADEVNVDGQNAAADGPNAAADGPNADEVNVDGQNAAADGPNAAADGPNAAADGPNADEVNVDGQNAAADGLNADEVNVDGQNAAADGLNADEVNVDGQNAAADGLNADEVNVDGLNADEVNVDGQNAAADGLNADEVNVDGQNAAADGLNADEVNVDGLNADEVNVDGQNAAADGLNAALGRDDAVLGRDDDVLGRDDDVLGRDDDVLGRDDDVLGRDDDVLGRDDDALGRDDDALGRDGIGSKDAENSASAATKKNQGETASSNDSFKSFDESSTSQYQSAKSKQSDQNNNELSLDSSAEIAIGVANDSSVDMEQEDRLIEEFNNIKRQYNDIKKKFNDGKPINDQELENILRLLNIAVNNEDYDNDLHNELDEMKDDIEVIQTQLKVEQEQAQRNAKAQAKSKAAQAVRETAEAEEIRAKTAAKKKKAKNQSPFTSEAKRLGNEIISKDIEAEGKMFHDFNDKYKAALEELNHLEKRKHLSPEKLKEFAELGELKQKVDDILKRKAGDIAKKRAEAKRMSDAQAARERAKAEEIRAQTATQTKPTEEKEEEIQSKINFFENKFTFTVNNPSEGNLIQTYQKYADRISILNGEEPLYEKVGLTKQDVINRYKNLAIKRCNTNIQEEIRKNFQ